MPTEPDQNVFALPSVASELPDAFFSSLLEQSGAGIFACDTDGNFVSANRAWQTATAKATAAISGKSFREWFDAENAAQFALLMRRVLESGAAAQAEFIFDGAAERTWFQITLFPVRNAVGEVAQFGGMATDVSAIRRKSEELEGRNAMLDALIAGTTDAVSVKDRDGRYLLINPSAAAINGAAIENLLGKTDHDLWAAEIAELARQSDIEVMDSGEAHYYERIVPRGDGTRIYWTTKDPLRDADGVIRGVISVSQDITRIKRAEAEIKEGAERLEIALRAGQLGIWQVDLQTFQAKVSDIGRQHFGFTPSEPVALATILTRIHPDDRDSVSEAVQKTLADRADFRIEYRLALPDGATRWIAGNGHLMFHEDGEAHTFIGTSQDITPRTERETELAALNIRLRRAMQETHHRIKNNLQVISALTELQVMESDGTVPVEEMQRIGQHARTLAGIHDLLTMQAATGSGSESLTAQTVLAKLLPMLQATSGGRHIRSDSQPALLSMRQSASFALLVSELVSNAIKHGKGDIEVSLNYAPSPASGEGARPYLLLEVCDDGPGFPPNFNPQHAAHTGLDLIDSVGRWDLQGEIHFTNRDCGGASVAVLFPQSEA